MTPAWEARERGLLTLEAERPPERPTVEFDYEWLDHYLSVLWPAPEPELPNPPRLRGVSSKRRLAVEQALARTGSIARAMAETGVDYEACHALLEWMAA